MEKINELIKTIGYTENQLIRNLIFGRKTCNILESLSKYYKELNEHALNNNKEYTFLVFESKIN